jgi:F-type H+-transporting ATPase subunit alpha
LDEATLKQLNRGEKMVELLKQGQYVPIPVARQVIIIWVGTRGHFDDIAASDIARFETEFLAFCDEKYPDIQHKLDQEWKISDELEGKLESAVKEFKAQFNTESE